MFAAFQYSKSAYEKDGDRHFSRLVAIGLGEDSDKVQEFFYDEGGETLEQVALGGGRYLIPGNVPGQM